MNRIQRRIKEYVDFLQRKYLEEAKKRYLSMSARERRRMPGTTWDGSEKLIFPYGSIEFSWHINIDCPGSPPSNCRFLLKAGGKQYSLILDQLPSELIEPVYEALSELTSLIERADKEIAATIESEISSFFDDRSHR